MSLKKTKHALSGLAQIAAVMVCAINLAYAQCSQSNPCATLTRIGTLGGTGSVLGLPPEVETFLFFGAVAVSNDGVVVVGRSRPPQRFHHAFRWTGTSRIVDLGTLGGPSS